MTFLCHRPLTRPAPLSDFTNASRKKNQQPISLPSILHASPLPTSFSCARDADYSNGTARDVNDIPSDQPLQVVLVSPQDFSYKRGDSLVFGSETCGLPPRSLARLQERRNGRWKTIRVPMVDTYVRCLNLCRRWHCFVRSIKTAEL